MKPNELMIGDWVLDKKTNRPYKIIGTNDLLFHNDYSPIPLTAEILEKNGFQQISTNKYVSGTVTIAIFVEEFLITIKSFGARVMITIKYIHELQHALQLCNIDKEIEL